MILCVRTLFGVTWLRRCCWLTGGEIRGEGEGGGGGSWGHLFKRHKSFPVTIILGISTFSQLPGYFLLCHSCKLIWLQVWLRGHFCWRLHPSLKLRNIPTPELLQVGNSDCITDS